MTARNSLRRGTKEAEFLERGGLPPLRLHVEKHSAVASSAQKYLRLLRPALAGQPSFLFSRRQADLTSLVSHSTSRYNVHMADSPAQHMTCIEVWGGSQLTSNGVELSGLDVWVYSKPYGEAQRGGDVYYVSSCATGRISRVLLADVSGHGTSVAATAADLRSLMRRFVHRLDHKELGQLLNDQFTELSSHGRFATAIVTTFFAPTRRLTLCNAGHPRPLLYRADSRTWSFLSHTGADGRPAAGNLPLGLIDAVEYEQFDVELAPGDCVLSYTDALMESHDADGEVLGEKGVLRIAR